MENSRDCKDVYALFILTRFVYTILMKLVKQLLQLDPTSAAHMCQKNLPSNVRGI